MKTAEQFLKNGLGYDEDGEIDIEIIATNSKYIVESMKEYAKQVAENTLYEAANNADYYICQNDDGQEPYHHETNIRIDRKSILNTEIKTP